MSHHRIPTSGDLALSRTVTALAVMAALAVAGLNLMSRQGSTMGTLGEWVAVVAGLGFGFGLLLLKRRGDFILGLFGYWWPFWLPKSDEMTRAIRQEAFGFAYLVILGAFLLIAAPLTFAAFLFEPVAEGLSRLVPEWTGMDAAACLLALLIVLAVLPQAYLAWTLKPLEADETDADGSEAGA